MHVRAGYGLNPMIGTLYVLDSHNQATVLIWCALSVNGCVAFCALKDCTADFQYDTDIHYYLTG